LYETSRLKQREVHRQKDLKIRVLRGKFGSKREEMAGGWIRLHIEELHNI
jgi:hypothetical protein